MSDYTPEHRAGDPAEQEPVIGEAPPQATTVLSNSAYDKLKPIVQVILPGVGALYFALAGIWGLPFGEQVVGTIAAVTVFLGLFLNLSSRQYQNSDARFDGLISVEPGEEEDTSAVRVQLDPIALADKDEVTVKVNRV